MKLTFLLLFMTITVIAVQLTTASPVQVVQAFNDGAVQKSNEVARQQTVAVPAAAAVPSPTDEDDDDDDDDDDDLDILDDDDDDDDEEGKAICTSLCLIECEQ